jgi:hypothetical protein
VRGVKSFIAKLIVLFLLWWGLLELLVLMKRLF